MPRITPFKIALACGAAGAYVDVTSYASWAPGEGVAGSWGRQDQFRDTTPGAFSFYLENYDGRFTPDTTNGLLSTPLTEGMGVSWQLGTRIIAGSILGFTMIEDNWGRIRVDADDMLGSLARNTIGLTARGMVLGAKPYLYWPFNDAVNSTQGTEQSGNQQPPFDSSASGFAPPTFGYTAISFLGTDTQVVINDSANVPFQTSVSPALSGQTLPGRFATINYATGSMGTWGAWFTALASPACTEVFIRLNGFNLAGSSSFRFGINSSGSYWVSMGSNNLVSSVPVAVGVPTYLQIVVTNSGSTSITAELFINGVSQGTCVWAGTGGDPNGLSTNYQRTPQFVSLTFGAAGAVAVSHLSHTPSPVPEYLLAAGNESALLTATVSTTYGAVLAALPSDLSTASSAPQSGSASALSRVNDVIRSEQGYLSCSTTGTLLAPVQTITVRARQRPATVSYSFDAQTELAGQPDLIRDLTNLVATETAQGPTTSTTWLDTTVSPRSGSANNSDSVVLTQYVDQLGFAQDRVNRGKNTAIRVVSFTVDALNTPTDRSADLLAIAFGDRVRLTNIPTTVTNFGSVDVWIIGRTEAQDRDQHKFTFYAQPVLPATGIYDTNLYMADGALTLSAGINAAVATMSVATTGPLLEQVQVPYTLLIDTEQVTVTACNGATPQVATITRGVNGTIAASHTTSATIELATPSLYAF